MSSTSTLTPSQSINAIEPTKATQPILLGAQALQLKRHRVYVQTEDGKHIQSAKHQTLLIHIQTTLFT